MAFDSTVGAPGALRPGFRRIAEQVADHLRARILHGDLAAGDLLPKEEDLRRGYDVSKSSFREAMRILEAEGLLTVRRGNVGGAVIHRPSPGNVAYTLAVVLSSRAVGIDDVASALRQVEPACAALCAARPDRAEVVLPALNAVHVKAVDAVGDLVAATRWSRRFHEIMVSVCGNETLIVMVGALETLWSTHETGWAESHTHPTALPVEERRRALDSHQDIIDLIARGDVDGVREAAARHLGLVQGYPAAPKPIRVRPDLAREHRSPSSFAD